MKKISVLILFILNKLNVYITTSTNKYIILKNTGWLFADKIIRMGIGLLVGVWVARYLGPTQFGQINYAIAFVGLFGAISGLGLNGIVVRDIVREPKVADEILGTSFLLQLLSSLLTVLLVLASINIINKNDEYTFKIVAITSVVLIFKSTEVVKYWFESQVKSQYTVWIENGVFIFISAIKVLMILSKATLMTFVCINVVESLLVAIGLILIFNAKGGSVYNWRVHIARAKKLLVDSWPLMLASISIMIYMRIDQIMLGQMLGDNAVGLYTAATRLSEIWYFIPITIAASLSPSIIKYRLENVGLYEKRLQSLFNFMMMLSGGLALFISLISPSIIKILYGDSYLAASNVLSIHIWTSIFVFSGVVSSQWFIAENLQKLSFYRTLVGAVSNVVINLLLIPRYGIYGAAWATLFSQALASVLFNGIGSSSRGVFRMQIRALFFVDVYKMLKGAVNR